jgi:hypothetical protein
MIVLVLALVLALVLVLVYVARTHAPTTNERPDTVFQRPTTGRIKRVTRDQQQW